MTTADNDDAYALVMPFVTVMSVGGPHEDAAYTAGYQMGMLAVSLRVMRDMGGDPTITLIHRSNLPQADLIAMNNGFLMAEVTLDVDGVENADRVLSEWAHVTFMTATTP